MKKNIFIAVIDVKFDKKFKSELGNSILCKGEQIAQGQEYFVNNSVA